MKNDKPCLVVFDDMMSLCSVYGLDPGCLGALTTGGKPAIFPCRSAARKAIRISCRFALLQKEQGIPEMTDFTEAISHVKIRDVKMISAEEEK